jgi:type I restriction enzyme, S subunit
MNESTKKDLVSALRFPEFRDTGEWGKKNLGELAIFLKGKGLPKSAITRNGKNLCVHYGELFTEYSEVIANINSRTDLYDGCFFSVENDVLMPTSDVTPNGLAKACCIKFDGVILGGDILVIRTDKTVINGEFISRQIRHLEQKVLQLVSGSTVFHLYASSIEKLVLLIPSFKEQQKIADCLSSIDELVTTQTQKLDALKAHKKGLMQQLFPAEGETVPKLRFPEFRDAEEWVLNEFSKYIVLYRGSSPRPIQNYLTNDSSGINWIKIGDTKYAENFIINHVEERITPAGATKSRKVDVGELILANSMSYGKTYQVAIAGCIYDGWFVLRDYEKHFDKRFLLQLLNSEYMQNQYERYSAGGIVQNISSDIVYKTVLPNTSLEEQQKIADCLSSVDDIITAQTQKLAAFKAHKKGLMQQLFPAVDEANG